jgi:hypothetical protein
MLEISPVPKDDTPLPMRYACMGYISMGFISMGYTSTGHLKC